MYKYVPTHSFRSKSGSLDRFRRPILNFPPSGVWYVLVWVEIWFKVEYVLSSGSDSTPINFSTKMGNYVRVRTFCYRYYITDLLFSTILTLNKSSNFILSVKVKLWGFKYPGTPEGGGIFSSSPCHKDTLIRLHKPFLLQIWHHRSIQKVNIDPSI